MKTVAFCLSMLVILASSRAAIQTQEVTYQAAGTVMKGFLAWDDDVPGKRPGVLVVHEWWGLNDYASSRAEKLAGLGYTALAVDMYGDGKSASHPADAKTFMMEATKDPATTKARFLAALEVLKSQPTVNPEKIAAIGYCFGGATVLSMARQGVDLSAVISFHGALGGLQPVQQPVKARILVCHGGSDSFIPEEQITAFQEEMRDTDTTFLVYPGAKHGFTNPGADAKAAEFDLDVGYNETADKASWEAMQEFLKAAFAGH